MSAEITPPHGTPIPGVANLGDVEWALRRAQIYLRDGGDRDNPAFREYLDDWLDYRLVIVGTALDTTAGPLHTMRPRVPV